jgi:hypothetical protein
VYVNRLGVATCDAASRVSIQLGNTDAATVVMPPPGIAIANGIVAFGQDSLSDATFTQRVTSVVVVNLARAGPGAPDYLTVLPAQPSPPNSGASSKVVKVVVRDDGAVAWISCASGDEVPKDDIATGKAARCVRLGTYAWVYRENASAESKPGGATLLAQGPDIAPLSLRLKGQTISWIQDHRWRTASLV